MRINWKVRFKNPVFWRNIIISFVAPMLTYCGMSWEMITTWRTLGELFVQAINNPVVLVAVVVSVWNAINDPTTAGDSDSVTALTYSTPKKSV